MSQLLSLIIVYFNLGHLCHTGTLQGTMGCVWRAEGKQMKNGSGKSDTFDIGFAVRNNVPGNTCSVLL